jgi:hypothetical protein
MNFIKKLFSGSPSAPQSNFHSFAVKCNRCGEIIEGHINLSNELSMEYEEAGNVYYVRKELMGSGKCFQRIEVEMKFNASKQLIEKQVQGGTFVG